MSLVGKNVGNYRVVMKIGEGGMGSVFLGEHPMIGKRVAIKTLHAELAQKEDIVSRFFTEAKAVNDIGHPNIVDIVDFGKMPDPDGGPEVVYFVMEFLDGEGLNARLKREGASPRETIQIVRQCASALAASHKKGIVHRDLKPENIYLIHRSDDKNYVKLLDFGIAKLTGEGSGVSHHKTRTGLVIGTPAYMSPEQCEGKGNIDWRSDVYSLGVVMYEMLTGRVPFPGDGFGEILVAHLTKTPELPSLVRQDVPASLEAIVMHAMEKDRNRRFQSMDELVAALDDPGAHLEAWGSPSGRSDTSATGTVMFQTDAGRSVKVQTGQGSRPTTGQGQRPVTGQGQRPTTLSGASGQVEGEAAPSGGGSRMPLFALIGLLVVGGGAGGAFFLSSKGHGKQPAVVVTPPVEKPRPPTTVTVKIHSTPEGAQVFRAPDLVKPVGTTPLTLEVKTSEPDFDVLVKAEGYKTVTKPISTQRASEMIVPLEKEAPAVISPPTTPTPVATPTNPGKGGGTKSGKGGGSKNGKGGKGGKTDQDDVMEPTFN